MDYREKSKDQLIAEIERLKQKAQQESEQDSRRALDESEAKYRILSETAPVGIVIHHHGVVLNANARVFAMMGYQPEEMAGENAMLKIIAPEYHQEIMAHIEAGNAGPYEVVAIRKDGSRFPIEVRSADIHYDGQKARIATMVDISERKETERFMRLQRDLSLAFSTAAGLSEILTSLIEHALKIEDIDAGGVYLRDQQTGELDMLVHRGLPKVFVDAVKHFDRDSDKAVLISKGESVFFSFADLGFPPEIEDKVGKLRAVAVVPIRHENQVVGCMNLASRSVDQWSQSAFSTIEIISGLAGGAIARVQAQEALFQSEQRLRQSEKMQAIGQLAGGVAHDFNNQLTGIIGNADLVQVTMLEQPEVSKYVGNILTAANRAADLTAKLLAFARKGNYLALPVDIHQIINEVASLLLRSVDKNIRIEQQLKAKKSVIIGDPTQLQNALLNLAINARDAMPDGGELLFATDNVDLDQEFCRSDSFDISSGAYLEILVKDTGMGIDREIQSRIFEPFFTTKKEGKGTGMGLAAVYGTINTHRGSLRVSSELKHGTAMKLHFPLAPSQKTSAMDETRPVIEVMGGSASIMVVDDEDLVLTTVSSMLGGLGYQVVQCRNGAEALKVYQKQWQNIDLVILDMVMPEMGGRAAFLEMRKINPDIVAVLSSGYSVAGEAQTSLREGVRGFLQKPYNLAELSRNVRALLENRQG